MYVCKRMCYNVIMNQSITIIIIINHACIAHITFREKSLCALRMKNTEGSKVKMGQVSKQ